MKLAGKIATGARLIRNITTAPAPADLSHLTFAVNNFCNGRCVMCNIWQVYRREPDLIRKELTADELRAAFGKSRFLKGIKHVLLTGGEPMLKADFVDIYLSLLDFNPRMTIGVASNGRATTLIVRKIQAIRSGLIRRGLTGRAIGIGLSLDGLGERHDRVRGVPGLFQAVLKTAEEVSSLPDTQLAFSFTIGPHNYSDLPAVYELACQFRAGLAYRCVQRSPIYYRNDADGVGWKPEQLRELRRLVEQIEERGYGKQPMLRRALDMGSYFNHMMLEYERQPHRLFECYSGTQSVFLDAYGNVLPCIIRDGSFGNIRDVPFDDIWESERARQVRASIAAHECHCWVDCEVHPSLGRQWNGYWYNIKNLVTRVVS